MARTGARLLLLLFAVGFATACREDGDIVINSLTFDGVSQVDKGALANGLQTKRGSRLPWGPKRYFDRREFEADLQRIVAFYRDRGFPDARVTSVDPKLDDKQDKIDITIHISEGEPIRVAALELSGFEVLPERAQRRLRRQLTLKEGAPLDSQLAAASREHALTELRNHGYPYAEVRLSNAPAGPKSERVVFQAVPGTLARFGPVQIEGLGSVGDQIVLRQLTFKPGDLFSHADMLDSQRKLYAMELFQFVNVAPLEDREQMPPEVPVKVTVGESKHRKMTFGLGYGSEEKARARVRWDHVNFFGGARHASLEARWSSLDRGIRAELKEPYFLHQNFSLSFQGQYWHSDEPAFTQTTRGGRVVLRHQATQQNFWSVSLINEYQSSVIAEEARTDFTIRDELIALGLDPDTGASHGTLSAVAFDIGRNTTNNLLDARRGYVLNGHVEQAGHWMWGAFNYWLATADARYFHTVARRFVLASRINLGTVDAADNSNLNVPYYKRFFLGGATSNRGWGRFEIAPLSSEGFPVGGLSMVDGSSEVRFPIRGNLGGVLFVDYSQVWPGSWQFDLRDLQYSVGPGLRYRTPIGPVRVDLGYQLNHIDGLLVNGEPEKRYWRVHFSIGQAF